MKYVIIGGVAAGMSAAMEIKRTDDSAEITVLERGKDYSYGQCGLPYVVNGLIPSTEKVIARTVETFREKYGIDARVHTKVTSVDTENQQVFSFYLDSDQPFTLTYDRLLIATGSDPILPEWPGMDLDGIHTLKTLRDTNALMDDITERVEHVTIVGAGYIGLEMAESFRSIGKKVTLIQRGDQLAKIFDEDMSKLIEKEAVYHQVDIKLEEEVTGFSGKNRVEAVMTDKGTYSTDLVLVSAGVKPNTKFLQDTGIQMNREGAIRVNAYMETSIPNVYAAGDCATHYHIIKQLDDYIPLGTTSNKQGRIAGANMAGNPITFKGIVGTSIMKFFDLALGRTGITETEAERLSIPYEVEIREDTNHASYYPGVETLHTKLIYHQKTNQLLGGQMIGRQGVDKRIDVLATALYNQMTIQQLQDLDLAYAPPYNSVWDPLQKISRKT
ncbi:CoA-disulfide reductase [Gracilibacillus salitolerans]|uniref:CoA-disulfide reductase n=1 Tax=Gracilibacillus salitolerans TaxID=2663022 RepID=A0A5Q2TK08_9BACI|nr:CoA-disulfide reductase [Gracilibacillus salitolerans]QGH35015.1 CoA-disulfide reductase [Gracilibacillus salitolerans]